MDIKGHTYEVINGKAQHFVPDTSHLVHSFYRKLRSGLSTEHDFEYSKFLNSFLRFFSKYNSRQKENTFR